MTATDSCAVNPSSRSVEEEFERFASALVGAKNEESVSGEGRSGSGSRDPRRPISEQFIYEFALELVAAEGIDALTVRRLAAELKISTRTLYKRIGNRTNMIREFILLHLARLDLVFDSLGTWEETTWAWCLQLHRALTAQPHLTHMARGQTLAALQSYVDALVEATVRAGIPRRVTAECCWSLAGLTINDAVGTGHAAMNDGDVPHTVDRRGKPSKTTADAITWIMLGVRTAASPRPTGRDVQ